MKTTNRLTTEQILEMRQLQAETEQRYKPMERYNPAERSERPKTVQRYNPAGANTAETRYKGHCGTCGG